MVFVVLHGRGPHGDSPTKAQDKHLKLPPTYDQLTSGRDLYSRALFFPQYLPTIHPLVFDHFFQVPGRSKTIVSKSSFFFFFNFGVVVVSVPSLLSAAVRRLRAPPRIS